jgi:uncharacterized protein (TIGR03790 family)
LLYSVFRLDGPSADQAKGMVDRAIATEQAGGLKGVGYFDRRMGIIDNVNDADYGAGDWDIHRAADVARAGGFSVVEDPNDALFGHAPAPLRCDNAAMYAGWYGANYDDAMTWAPGAIGFHTQSFSASGFRDGLYTSWAAGALYRGITVTSGPIQEPYLNGVLHPDGVYKTLMQGASVGDAFLRNIEYLRWQVINFGDPLYVPFKGGRP